MKEDTDNQESSDNEWQEDKDTFSDDVGFEEVKESDNTTDSKDMQEDDLLSSYNPLRDEVSKDNYDKVDDEIQAELSQEEQSEQPTQKAPTKKELQADEKRAAHTADFFLMSYERLHGLARYLGKYDLEKLASEHISGKIDLDFIIPINDERTCTLRSLLVGHNDNITNTIIVTQEFKDEVKPLLIEIFLKHGWFITTELMLIMLFVEDISTKAMLIIASRKAMNMNMKIVAQAIQAINKQKSTAKEASKHTEKSDVKNKRQNKSDDSVKQLADEKENTIE